MTVGTVESLAADTKALVQAATDLGRLHAEQVGLHDLFGAVARRAEELHGLGQSAAVEIDVLQKLGEQLERNEAATLEALARLSPPDRSGGADG